MNLQTELERVREYSMGTAPPPSNEANTCDWIIRPLLQQCGYNYHDIHAQGHDAAGNIPDYTILPNSPHTWFLEAKAWQVSITDTHVNQAANYVNTTAKRWFVVSNGREWRLYDNHIVQVPPSNRLVVAARLDCGTELEDLLTALSKPSVQAGKLEQYALQTALNTTLQQELAALTSDVVQAIVNALKTKSGLYAVTPDAVVDYFHGGQVALLTCLPTQQPSAAFIVPSVHPTSKPSQPSVADVTLPEMMKMGEAVEGRKPQVLTFPDGTSKPISSWRNMATGIIEWLFTRGKVPPLPFIGGKGNKCYLISSTPVHPNGKSMKHTKININGHVYLIDIVRSSRNYVSHLNTLCKEVGESPEGFRVTLQ